MGEKTSAHLAELTLLRHAQARFASNDYDRLSPLGQEQARLLGQWLRESGQRFDRVALGSMRRHRETLAAMAESLAELPAADVLPGLNEYDFGVLLKAYAQENEVPPDLHSDRRTHFRTLRLCLRLWARDALPHSHLEETWAAFHGRVRDALDRLTDPARGERVLAVTSGGPIATMVMEVLGLQPDGAFDLNLQIRNASQTRLIFTGKRRYLNSFNSLPHLEQAGREALISYS